MYAPLQPVHATVVSYGKMMDGNIKRLKKAIKKNIVYNFQ